MTVKNHVSTTPKPHEATTESLINEASTEILRDFALLASRRKQELKSEVDGLEKRIAFVSRAPSTEAASLREMENELALKKKLRQEWNEIYDKVAQRWRMMTGRDPK